MVDRRELGGILYQLEWRTCGSKNKKTGAAWCRCFAAYPSGGHGPYWYAYWREPKTGRRKSRYIGKAFRGLEGTEETGGQAKARR
ncbi:MAG: hypothetical protein KUG77_07265 [Nannocystaceae bacterium]|nr:hypothetical protein [Nannocystaceae bacterium]